MSQVPAASVFFLEFLESLDNAALKPASMDGFFKPLPLRVLAGANAFASLSLASSLGPGVLGLGAAAGASCGLFLGAHPAPASQLVEVVRAQPSYAPFRGA